MTRNIYARRARNFYQYLLYQKNCLDWPKEGHWFSKYFDSTWRVRVVNHKGIVQYR